MLKNIKKLLIYLYRFGIVFTVKRIYFSKFCACLTKLLLPIYRLLLHKKCIQNVIVFESHNDFDCNSGALYDYLIKHKYNGKYKIVWLIKNKRPKKLPFNVYAYNFWFPSFAKFKLISRAKYIFNEQFFIEKFFDEQVCIYLTHGCITFKNVIGLLRIQNNVNYMLSSSNNYDVIVVKNYSINTKYTKLIHLGYPCNDSLFNDEIGDLYKLTSKKYKKIILWMPTFRKTISDLNRNDSNCEYPLGLPLFKNSYELFDLNNYLSKKDVLLIVKFHPYQDMISCNKLNDLSNMFFIDAKRAKELSIDNYKLMKSVDAFIGDYTSAAYSFLLLNRPMAFILQDINDYKLGFIVKDYELILPGFLIYKISEFYDFINDLISNNDVYSNKRKKLVDYLYKYKDGNSCKRIVEYFNF